MSADRGDGERIGLLVRTPTPAFAVRVVVLPPGCELVYDEAAWQDALVEVERGELELELRGGHRCVFASGAVLWLVGLPVRALHNRGREPAVVVCASRHGGGSACPAVAKPAR